MSYKEQLLRGLIERDWEQTTIEDGAGWWADEHWRIRSVRENWGDEIILTFLVDPQWDEPRKKGNEVPSGGEASRAHQESVPQEVRNCSKLWPVTERPDRS